MKRIYTAGQKTIGFTAQIQNALPHLLLVLSRPKKKQLIHGTGACEQDGEKDMKVRITKLTDWNLVVNLARRTVNKYEIDGEPSQAFKSSILMSEHSPIRALMFKIDLIDIPYWVSVHLVRHKHGVEHYVTTQRSDRTGVDRAGKTQDALVSHTMIINAQAIINISRKRLCGKASSETRELWNLVKQEMESADVDVARFMRPECKYRGGVCPEPESCVEI